MYLLLFGLFLFFLFGVLEFTQHKKNQKGIPIRVQVNGTRGKSSVTRLIAAGLRGGGLKVISKTTGTTPRFQIDNKTEFPIRRLGKANIIEEVRIVREAAKRRPDALVIECMALVPQYQKIEREKLINPTIGVITNVRADHLDVMGPTVLDVATSLANTCPKQGILFTAEREFFFVFKKRAEELKSMVVLTNEGSVSDEEMEGFSYWEHKENVALALAVCEYLGIKREDALRGMKNSLPDPGVLRVYRIKEGDKEIRFFNALAANDPDSTKMIAEKVFLNTLGLKILLVNLRADRQDRSRQLGEMVKEINFDYILLTGKKPLPFLKAAKRVGVKEEKILNLTDSSPASVYEQIFSLINPPQAGKAVILAVGNIVGYGQELVDFFAQKSVLGGKSA
ncbi:MAG: poly-gamma-glutamate synthase PgsB [candidate division WOR-3 bacterium]